MDWEPDPQTSHRERGHELTLLFAPFEMYFHFENGYDPSDLVVQIRQEKKVAKDIGLTQRSHFLGLMENLVCHFHEIRNVESTTSIRTGMSMELIKMKMSNEAESILSHLNDHNPPKPPQRKKRLRKKLYKYPCSVSMQLSMCGYALDGVRRRGQARFGDFDIFCPNNFQICHPSLDTEIGKKYQNPYTVASECGHL